MILKNRLCVPPAPWSMRSADRVVRDDGVVVARKGAL